MSTFLQLCQDVARDSGTVPTIGDPATVVSQTGRLLRIVTWVNDAYRDIQTSQRTWRWLQGEFSGTTIAGTQRYAASSMGIASRFSHWIYRRPREDSVFSIYLTASGQSDEGFLEFVDWDDFYRLALQGSSASQTGKPVWITIDPANQLALYPIPDDVYTVRGLYYKGPQALSVDGDIPEMPEQFHEAIKWRALVLLGLFDEAPNQVPGWLGNYESVMEDLRSDQLPRIQFGGPLV